MSDVPATYRMLAAHYGNETEGADMTGRITLEEVRRFVAEHVARLLDRNPELLMSILYRIDVAEEEVRSVLARARREDIPQQLADLIVERQLEKAAMRRRYRSALHR